MKDFSDDLMDVAERAMKLLSMLDDDKLTLPLKALDLACDEVDLAWSGSNVGFHADVYYKGLAPKPPDVQFSKEWGFGGWGGAPGWEAFDRGHVQDDVLGRAGDPDVEGIKVTLAVHRKSFEGLREEAIGILSAATSEKSDKFLERKLDEIEKLRAPNEARIADNMIPGGQYMTRDTLALGQGLKNAPHQVLKAVPLAAKALEWATGRLESSAREAASHLKRLSDRQKQSGLIGTNVFVGHGRSPIWRELKDFIEDRLGLPVDEFNSVPVAGVATVARLSELMDAAAFAFLVLTAEDEQKDGGLYARLNVVHELGLFQGRLGFSRAIVLLEEGCAEFSNIHGLGQIRFPSGKISAVFEDVRAVLEREELIEPVKKA